MLKKWIINDNGANPQARAPKSWSLWGALFILLSSLPTQAKTLDLADQDGHFLREQDLKKIESKNQEGLMVDPNLAKKADDKLFSIQLRTYAGIDSYNPDVADITQSYFAIIFGKNNYYKYLNEFRETSKQTTVVQFSAKFALGPAILRDSVLNHAQNKMNEKIDQIRSQYFAAAAGKIHQKISSLIQTGSLTASEGQVMEAKFISSAKNIIDSQIQQIKVAQEQKLEQRFDSLEKELTFEEFALKIGQKILQTDEGALLIFGEVGKTSIDPGLAQNTGLNSITPLVWWGPRGMTTTSTGVIQMGLEWISKNNIKVGIESYFFHDRLPTISQRRVLTELIYMNDQQFERHENFWKINSNLQRFYVKIPSLVAKTEDQFYFSTGDYEGKRGTSAGILVRIMPKVSVEVDAAFNRPQFDYAITESLRFHATDKITFYFVNENTQNLSMRYDTGEVTSKFMRLGSAGVGATYRLVDVLITGIQTTLDINAECRYFYENVASSIEAQIGCGGAIMLNAKY